MVNPNWILTRSHLFPLPFSFLLLRPVFPSSLIPSPRLPASQSCSSRCSRCSLGREQQAGSLINGKLDYTTKTSATSSSTLWTQKRRVCFLNETASWLKVNTNPRFDGILQSCSTKKKCISVEFFFKLGPFSCASNANTSFSLKSSKNYHEEWKSHFFLLNTNHITGMKTFA